MYCRRFPIINRLIDHFAIEWIDFSLYYLLLVTEAFISSSLYLSILNIYSFFRLIIIKVLSIFVSWREWLLIIFDCLPIMILAIHISSFILCTWEVTSLCILVGWHIFLELGLLLFISDILVELLLLINTPTTHIVFGFSA